MTHVTKLAKALMILALLVISSALVMAQAEKAHNHNHDADEEVYIRSCGTMQVHEHLMATDPDYKRNFEAQEAQTMLLAKNRLMMAPTEAVRTIRVIVHVVYNTSTENISDAQVQSQIRILNEDYARANADAGNTPSVFSGLAANTQIQFVLDRIIRKQTTVTSWSTNDYVKYTSRGGSDVIEPASYLNIWVCNLGGGVLGYAQFPGGASATDGVVIGYKYFGDIGTATAPFNKGRTATHEVGHYLNLRHIWGDDGTACTGTDYVDDTPNQADENYGCPTFPTVSCSNGPNGDMFMNYMDYTDDACMNMFSAGQSARMNATLDGARSGLVSGSTTPTITVTAPNGGENWTVNTTRTITWTSTGTIANVKIEYSVNSGSTWTTIVASTSNTGSYSWTVPNNPATTCRVRVSDASNAATNDISNANFTISASSGGYITAESESNNTSGTANGPVGSGVAVTGAVSSSTDVDYFTFTTGSVGTISISLAIGTSADLDWYLYDAGLVEKAKGYTTSNPETGSYANAPAGTYYIKVNGYSGATSAYTLNVTYPGAAANSITVTSPNGGENWAVGSSKNITWTSTGSIANVKIEYSVNSGSTWTTIVASTANTGTYAWTVPNNPATTCRVRVSDAAASATNDVSNANFTISSGGTTVTLLSEGFESNAVPGTYWLAADQNSTSGSDYWGDKSSSSSARVHSGTWSAWCADNGRTGTTYDNNMNSYMEYKNGLNITGYSNVQISFWIWYKTYDSYDYCSFQYYNGTSWVEFTNGRWYGTGTTWAQKTFSVPAAAGTTFKFRWVFYSNSSSTSEGVYIDDILVTGVSGARMEFTKDMDSDLPKDFTLEQNYPNPFNPSTTINFALPKESDVTLNIYNVNGQLVRTLASGRYEAGRHHVVWDGRNNFGQTVSTGVYIYRIAAGNFVKSCKMMFIK